MSLPGIRSARGDAYQVQVALEWTIRLLTDRDIVSVQFESLGDPDGGLPPRVDDVVVRTDERTVYIQAKKNEPARGVWVLTNPKLAPELVKAREQLERDPAGEAWFYSQSPFGRFEQLVEEARLFPTYAAFAAAAADVVTETLDTLARVVSRDAEAAFGLARRIRVKHTLDFEDWDRALLRDLRALFARPEDVADLLVQEITRRQARLHDPTVLLTREMCEALLHARGHRAGPERREADMLAAFARASRRGRSWKEDIDGERFQREETQAVLEALEDGDATVVVTSRPGMGKTCVLLDVVRAIEARDGWAVLFLKGDQYEGAATEADLVGMGVPDGLVGQASRLAVTRRVVVVVDALDVLSLQRASGTLSLFLGLLDELSGVPGVSTVAACRDFDLGYAPELRDREWDARVAVGLLPVADVERVLRRWGVAPEALAPEFVEQIRVAQHLRLYGQLVRAGVTEVAAGPYALHDRYLDEIVRADPVLGDEALDALGHLAARMQRERRLVVPRSSFTGGAVAAERLLSAEVLTETRPGVIAFSHQELMDCVAVRQAVRSEATFLNFLAGHAPLPFLRPAARTFFFILRAVDPVTFRRQVRAVLDADDVAYHLRRLVAESLAEIVPGPDDDALLRWLWRRHPDLFERFLAQLHGSLWLPVALQMLIEARERPEPQRWVPRLLSTLVVWFEHDPEVLLGTWAEALRDDWPGARDASWIIMNVVRRVLERTGNAPPAEAGILIRELLRDRAADHTVYEMTGLVQLWVEATDGDDDLVWELLQLRQPPGTDLDRLERGSMAGISAEFLRARLVRSDWLLDVVLDGVSARRDGVPVLARGTLDATSWRVAHRGGTMPDDGALVDLLTPIEVAVAERARRGDAWWAANEPTLRTDADPGVRYLAVQAYLACPERHADGSAALLSDPSFVGAYRLESEVRALAYAVYPYLSDDQREAHQQTVLDRYDPADETTREWRSHEAYAHLVWVPALWRSEAAQAYVEVWRERYGPWRPSPTIYGGGGMVGAPFGSDTLLALPDARIVDVALHYGTDSRWESDVEGNPIGGWEQVLGVFSDAACRAPVRMQAVLAMLLDAGAAPHYPDAILMGLGRHGQRRTGRIASEHPWTPSDDDPDEAKLARGALRLLEVHGDHGFRPGYHGTPAWREGEPWVSEYTACSVLEGCSGVLHEPDDVSRQTLLLVRLLGQAGPDDLRNGAESASMNELRGQIAGCAADLLGWCLESGADAPDLLLALVRRLAADASAGARYAVVTRLAWIAYHNEVLGWELADVALDVPDEEVWGAAEQLLYRSYLRRFERVGPHLAAMVQKGCALAAWGRISALSVLAGHIATEALLADLPGLPKRRLAWRGPGGGKEPGGRGAPRCMRARDDMARRAPGHTTGGTGCDERSVERSGEPVRPGRIRRAPHRLARGPGGQPDEALAGGRCVGRATGRARSHTGAGMAGEAGGARGRATRPQHLCLRCPRADQPSADGRTSRGRRGRRCRADPAHDPAPGHFGTTAADRLRRHERRGQSWLILNDLPARDESDPGGECRVGVFSGLAELLVL